MSEKTNKHVVKSISAFLVPACIHKQVIYVFTFFDLSQMNAGAVMLTDSVYWCIIFPFLTIQDYNLNIVSSTKSLVTPNSFTIS